MSRINIRYYKRHPPRLLTPLERQIGIVYRDAVQLHDVISNFAERICDALTSWYDYAYSNPESMKTWICECEKEIHEKNKIRMFWYYTAP